MRTIIASGITVILFLILPHLAENILTNKIYAGEKNLLKATSMNTLIEKTEIANRTLTANLLVLNGLKVGQAVYSNLLLKVSEIVNDRICLIDLTLKNPEEGRIYIEILGLAYSQQDVAELMQGMEQSDKLFNVALLYSNSIDIDQIKMRPKIPQKKIIKFNLSADYHAGKK